MAREPPSAPGLSITPTELKERTEEGDFVMLSIPTDPECVEFMRALRPFLSPSGQAAVDEVLGTLKIVSVARTFASSLQSDARAPGRQGEPVRVEKRILDLLAKLGSSDIDLESIAASLSDQLAESSHRRSPGARRGARGEGLTGIISEIVRQIGRGMSQKAPEQPDGDDEGGEPGVGKEDEKDATKVEGPNGVSDSPLPKLFQMLAGVAGAGGARPQQAPQSRQRGGQEPGEAPDDKRQGTSDEANDETRGFEREKEDLRSFRRRMAARRHRDFRPRR